MSTDRLSLRATLAPLLAGSAILFLVGISLERGALGSTPPGVVESSAHPASSAPAEGSGGEAGEVGNSAPATAAATGEGTGETAGEHSAETWPLGVDLEAPILVGAVIVVSLVLAVAVVSMTSPLVPLAIVGFAVVFGLFDLLEVVHLVGQARTGLAAIALVLLVAHAAAGLIALRLLANRNPAMSSTA